MASSISYSTSRKRGAENDHDNVNGAKRCRNLPITQLQQIYGKTTSSSRKAQCFALWKEGKSFGRIAETLSVKPATAEIYIIDYIFLGNGSKEDQIKMLRELKISKDEFDTVVKLLSGDNVKLRELKDSTGFSYNQIRAIIAALVNGFDCL
ncbi:hypothetical protein AC249_AIPGENE12861 [Exaiptasia diaphana]|nr:hypothetical protein AC249_AIPGENE12861 [Exaiptasia diaphana]